MSSTMPARERLEHEGRLALCFGPGARDPGAVDFEAQHRRATWRRLVDGPRRKRAPGGGRRWADRAGRAPAPVTAGHTGSANGRTTRRLGLRQRSYYCRRWRGCRRCRRWWRRRGWRWWRWGWWRRWWRRRRRWRWWRWRRRRWRRRGWWRRRRWSAVVIVAVVVAVIVVVVGSLERARVVPRRGRLRRALCPPNRHERQPDEPEADDPCDAVPEGPSHALPRL